MAEPLKVHDIAPDRLKRLIGCVMETDKGTITLKLFPAGIWPRMMLS